MVDQVVDFDEVGELFSRGEGAVAELIDRYREKLLRMISVRMDYRIRSKVDGEDILQDVYVESARRIDDYIRRPSVPFFIWLRQITRQVLIDTHRRYLETDKRDVRREATPYAAEWSCAGSVFLATQLADSLTSPSQCAVRGEVVTRMNTAMEQLNHRDREVLVLRHLEELSNNEVAEVLRIDRYAASKRYLRALARLRRVMPDGE
jgi:RNA polymerase sigma-70 factor, ECF subfamily